MWVGSIAHGTSAPSERYETDRRSSCRYPINLPLRYTVIQAERATLVGSGTTLNISSRSVLFAAQDELPGGSEIELSVYWPVRLQDSCALQLVMRGPVVRTCDNAIAIIANFREFRTAGSRAATDLRALSIRYRACRLPAETHG